MDYHVLGALEVLDQDALLPLRGAKQRALLAILLTRAGRLASVDWLIDELWAGDPPETAGSALRVHVTGLRRVLEPERPRSAPSVLLPRVHRGYLLAVESDHVDAQRFERAAVLGSGALAAGSVADAASVLDAGLALWRGRPFEGLEDIDCVRIEAERLVELRLRAREDLADARLQLGQHAAIIGELVEGAAANPLRERTTAQLAPALYRSGRQAEALDAIKALRFTLRDQLGLDPTPALGELEFAILEHDPTIQFVGESRAAAPLRSRTTPTPHFVGRKRELDVMRLALESVQDGPSRAVFVSGAPGMGKTALGGVFAGEVASLGVAVCFGRCDAEPIGPFQPFREALRALLRTHPIDAASGAAAELARLVPDVLPDARPEALAGPLDAERDRHRFFEAVARLLHDVASPVVFVFDDLQWADVPTLLLLQHLLRHDHAGRVLVVGLFRDSDVRAGDPLSSAVRRLDRVGLADAVALDGLDEAEVDQLVRVATLPDVLHRALERVPELRVYTGGNPFFLREVLQGMSDHRGGVPRDFGELLASESRDLVAERLDHLAPGTDRILRTASVIGLEFDLTLLAAASGSDEDAVLDAIEEALGTRLVQERGPTVDRFGFAHSLLRDVVYREIPTSRRKRLHRDVGRALQQLLGTDASGRAMELAHHQLEAVPVVDAAVAAQHALRAVSEAESTLAFEVAVDLCGRGLAVLDDDDVVSSCRRELLLAKGRCEFLAGQVPARDTLLQAAEEFAAAGDADGMATALLSFNRGFFARTGQTDRPYVELLERALALRASDEDATSAELLATLASELVWADDGDRRFGFSDRALEMARGVGDGRTLARVLLLRQMAIAAPDTVRIRRQESGELLQLAERLGDPDLRFQATFHAAGTAAESGDLEVAHDLSASAGVIAAGLGQPSLVWLAQMIKTSSLIGLGSLDEAEQCAERALELGTRANRRAEAGMFFGEQLFEVRRWQDRLGEVVDLFGALAGGPQDFGCTLLRFLVDAGRVSEADAIYRVVMERTVFPLPRNLVTAPTLGNLAFVAAAVGADGDAPVLYSALEPWADVPAKTTVTRSVGHHPLGLLAASMDDLALAETHLAAAVDAHRAMGLPLLAAEALVDLAAVRVRLGSGTEDLVLELSEVDATANRHGAPYLARHCAALRGGSAL